MASDQPFGAPSPGYGFGAPAPANEAQPASPPGYGFGAPPAPADGGFGAPPPAYGAPSPYADPYGAPQNNPYGAPPPQGAYGGQPGRFEQQANQGFNQVGAAFGQAGQKLDQAFGQPNQMQPYGGGAPMMGPGGGAGMMSPGGPGVGKPWLVTLLLCFFAGAFGVHRFYVGKMGTGIAMLLTLGGCGIWQIYDLIMIITGKFVDAQGRPLVKDV